MPDPVQSLKEPFGEIVRFVSFRYWDGSNWQAGWTNASPPVGVEILLSTVAKAEDAEPESFPPEMIRRVVFVPGGSRLQQTTNSVLAAITPQGER